MNIAFYNGQFLPSKELRLPINIRGFHFGDGVFTTIRVADGIAECLQRHLKRLQEHCQELGIFPPDIREEWIKEIIIRNHAQSGVWRLKIIITGGESPSLDMEPRRHDGIIMMIKEYNTPPETPYRLTFFPQPVHKPTAHIKTLAYLDRLWIKDDAMKRGFHDAITMTSDKILLETSSSNLFWRHENHLFTPSKDLPLLPGISLSVISEAAKVMGMQVHEVHATIDDIPHDSQVYVSNALIGFHPVDAIEERTFKRDTVWERDLIDAKKNP